MNNDANIEQELKEFKDEGLILDYTIEKDLNKEFCQITGFTIIILENTPVKIEIDDAFCYRVVSTGKIYETFESMLNSISPLYGEKFGDILFQKINANANNRSNSISDEED